MATKSATAAQPAKRLDMSFIEMTEIHPLSDGTPRFKDKSVAFPLSSSSSSSLLATSTSSPSSAKGSTPQETSKKTTEVFKLTKEAWADVCNNPSWSNRVQFGIAIIFIVIWELLKALWQLGIQQVVGKTTPEKKVEKK